MEYIEICRTDDFVESTQLEHILEDEGIPVRVLGPRTSEDVGLTGFDPREWKIAVPLDRVDEATAVVNAFRSDIEPENDEELPWELREDGDG